MVCIVFVYCTVTNLALWLQRTKAMFICLLTRIIYYSELGRAVEYCDERVCLSVCLSVRTHISETKRPIFTKFSVHFVCLRM